MPTLEQTTPLPAPALSNINRESIAIVGIGCRFPGGANDAESFWKLLVEGREAVCEVPPDRWNVLRYYDAEPGVVGKSIACRGGFIEGIDQFDPQFFGISPREAPYVDPQHRLLLETAYEAIEDAGLVLDLEEGSNIGVFVGVAHNDYSAIQGTPWDQTGVSPHTATGSAHSIAANRISYCFNLKGPSIAMDTACSAALTAVHVACENLLAGKCDSALAGGVTVMITPGGFIGFSQASMLSPDGHCKAFDASANGFVRGEGAGMVLLKPLSKAIADGDTIYAVIMGSAVNQDGHTNGISLPNAEAQARLVRLACADAGIAPSDVQFVEAHGTGTAVGDPIEAHALAEALCVGRSADAPLAIGSVKTNLGHLETAAGIAGLVKAALVAKHGQIPASLHFDTPNPNIDFDALKLRVPTALEDFPSNGKSRYIGVNSFGFGGSNAHMILTDAPRVVRAKKPIPTESGVHPIMLSARSEPALRAAASQLGVWLEAKQHLNGDSPLMPDLTYTLGARRNHHPHRLALVARSIPEVIAELDGFASGSNGAKVRTAFTPRRETPPRMAFVMSGQGPQWWGMGRELMQHESVFHRMMEACAKAITPWADFDLMQELARSEADSQMSHTKIAQPAIFAMQVSLAELWKSWGVVPAAIIGHSMGEVAAACVAGVLSLDEAARVVTLRARLMEGCARGEGTMLAIGLGGDDARALIARHDPTITISAFNGPKSLTLSGPRASLEVIAAELEGQGIFNRLVKVDHPFHHPLMEPAATALAAALADLKPQAETVPFFSTVSGGRQTGLECDGEYWGQGIREAVHFAASVSALNEFGVDVWLELSAHPALSNALRECLSATGGKPVVMASARRDREYEAVVETALDLHLMGVTLDFTMMTPSRRLLALPAYPWDKSRWWSESSDWREGRLAPGGRGLLNVRLPRAIPTWTVRLDSRHMAYLKDHKVENLIIFPAAAFIEMILEAGVQFFEGKPFAVEDFEIRKPLLLPDPALSLLLELTYDPNERTFSIQSRFDHAAAWSLHVVGSMRGERTESGFNTSSLEGSIDGLHEIAVGGFYQHMRDLGLPYGDEFRPIRELSADNGRSAGKVALSDVTAHRAGEYQLHPVLMDGALQIFSSGAATLEGRKTRMKLPVRFSRILFLRSPGATSRVRATVLQCTDDLVEGDIELYDEEGKPCVLVEGFRAISVASARRAAAPGGMRDLLYHVAWERTPSSGPVSLQKPVPLARLHDVAKAALDEVIESRGLIEIEAGMAASDALTASQLASALRNMEASPSAVFDAETMHIAEPMRLVFERLMAKLAHRGMLTKEGAGYRPTALFTELADSVQTKLKSYIAKNPGHLIEGQLSAETCAELGPILRGEKDAVQVLFAGAGAELLEQFYGDGLLTSHWLGAIACAVQEAARSLPEGRGLRILEVGAGTAGLSAHVLSLLERGVHSYTFTDVSAAFFPAALQKLASFPEVECKILDLENSGVEQGFIADDYDLVIGTNVLHAVCDVRATLRNIHELLAPGGSLLFVDVATPQLWTEAVFGLTKGWWRFTDRELRPEQPLLERAQWEAVLKESGFSETASLPGLHGPEGEGQIGLLARKVWSNAALRSTEVVEVPTEQSWLVFANDGGLGAQLATLKLSGVRCRIVRRGAAYEQVGRDSFTIRAEVAADWMQLMQACVADAAPERVAYFWSMDESSAGDNALMGTDSMLHLAQALEKTCLTAKLRIDLITRGAEFAGHRSGRGIAVAEAPSIGVLRVIRNEHSNHACRSIDLPFEAQGNELELLWGELQRTDVEREIAFRGEARYVKRLCRGKATNEQELAAEVPLRLESRERGHLDTLRFVPFAVPACGEGEICIEVKAAGMNFRDVLKALALYPGDAPDAKVFGDEVAGIIKSIGPGVTNVAVGDRVFGLAVFGLATKSLARAGDVRAIPKGLSFDEAATLPVVFMTSWYALKNVARLRKGERVLIQAGAGGVGMAAIQIALHLGCEVIASAGSAGKRALLKTLGVQHAIDSRRGDFVDAVMRLTNKRGVDVVLNSLAGEAIPMGMSCLAESGRFLEIGKRDIYQNARIPLWPLRRNASFHVIAMDAVFGADAELTQQLLGEISDLVETGALHPLPFRSFPACRTDAAFRLMAAGKHTGKVVVAFPASFVPRRGEPLVAGFEVKPDASYLITGAFGGYGQVIAHWLVECGARHLVLTSRNGASTDAAKVFVAGLEARGIAVLVMCGDIGSAKDVTMILNACRAATVPLKGVFHLAMVIDDAPLDALTSERMRKVIAPKAHGAWLLHEGTKDLQLDAFTMFSSVSSLFGNSAQGNYAAANAFLDALAHHRHALGLPALTVNWGALGGEGYVARNERVAEYLAKQGTGAISPGEVVTLLESFLTSGVTQVAACRVDWVKWRQHFRGIEDNPLLEHIFAAVEGQVAGSGATSDWRDRIEAASAVERGGIITLAVRDAVGVVLRVKPESLREDQPLTDLGLDSLMAVEIESSIETAIGVSLPPASLMRARTIGQIVTLIIEHMGGQPAVIPAAVVKVETVASADVDVNALTDAEVDRLLGADSSFNRMAHYAESLLEVPV